MTRTVFCQKLNRELPGLEFQPYPGPLGEKIFKHISKEAWGAWMREQTILINEHKLNVLDSSSKKLLEDSMEKFLFGNNP